MSKCDAPAQNLRRSRPMEPAKIRLIDVEVLRTALNRRQVLGIFPAQKVIALLRLDSPPASALREPRGFNAATRLIHRTEAVLEFVGANTISAIMEIIKLLSLFRVTAFF